MEVQMELSMSVPAMDGQPVTLSGLASQYSGAYIRERNPKLAALIVLAVGRWRLPSCQVSAATGVHESAIAHLVRDATSLSLEEDKREVLAGLRDLRRSAIGWLQRQFDSGLVTMAQFQQVAVMLGIVTEKHELLAGGATSRVERTMSEEELALRSQFLGLGNGPGMVLDAENVVPNAGLPAPVDLDALPSGGLQTKDCQTSVNDAASQQNQAI